MKKFYISSVIFFLLTASTFAGTINLPKTGQTKCWDTAGTEIECEGTIQDGEIQAGTVWPEPRFTDNDDGTMTDNLTCLMWTKSANAPGVKTWQHALEYANTLTLAGYSDWRLPNVNELESLFNANETYNNRWLNGQGFTDVQAGNYWSSTTYAYLKGAAWGVQGYGQVYGWYKSNSHYVWPVRGGQCGSLGDSVICLPQTGQTICYDTAGVEIPCTGTGQDGDIQAGVAWPNPRFTDNNDGTATDNLTGLMWTKNAHVPGDTATWQLALDYVKGMNIGTYPNFGHTDWRLPNRKELQSLTDFSRYSPRLPTGHPFIDVQQFDYHWSSTTCAFYKVHAWDIYMGTGSLGNYNKPDYHYVWPVRGPSEPTLITLSSFTATPSDKSVMLTWTTESEIDNAGFNIYRAEGLDGDYTKINSSLIPAVGTSGGTYHYLDTDVINRTTYFYKLENVDLYGKSRMNGPRMARPRFIYGIRQ